MNIPDGTVELAVGLTVGFVFKVVFGLIGKNEDKSDLADTGLNAKLEKLDDRYRDNDRELYERTSTLAAEVQVLKAEVSCMRGSK